MRVLVTTSQVMGRHDMAISVRRLLNDTKHGRALTHRSCPGALNSAIAAAPVKNSRYG